MAYTGHNWVDDGNPALDAETLNEMEAGIVGAYLHEIVLGSVSNNGTPTQNVNIGFKPSVILGADKSGTIEFMLNSSSNHPFCQFQDNGFNLTTQTHIDNNNINKFFTIVNSSPYFFSYDEDSNFFISNNKGIHNSTAKTVLTALQDMELSFKYKTLKEYSDKFTIKHDEEIVLSADSSSETKSKTIKLSTGDKLTFTYSKDYRDNEGEDCASFGDMYIVGLPDEFFYVAIK